jgi:hypothetical protein
VGEIEDRLAAVPAKGESQFVGLALPVAATTELWNLRQLARADVAYLLAELRKAREALGRVDALADKWEAGYGPGTRKAEVFGPQKVSIEFAVKSIRAAVAAANGDGNG